MCCLLNRRTCAKFLGVSVRTVQNWDAGTRRVPWSVVRLLRLLRQGDLGALEDGWKGFKLVRGKLVTPDGRVFRQEDLRRWWLMFEQAHLFRKRYEAEARGVGRSPAETLQPGAGEAAVSVEVQASPIRDDVQPTAFLVIPIASGMFNTLDAMVHKAFRPFLTSQPQWLPVDSDARLASECLQIPHFLRAPSVQLRPEGPLSNTGLTRPLEAG
jgi:hypothetical protein